MASQLPKAPRKTSPRLLNTWSVVHTKNVSAGILAAQNPMRTKVRRTSARPAATKRLFVGNGSRQYPKTVGVSQRRRSSRKAPS